MVYLKYYENENKKYPYERNHTFSNFQTKAITLSILYQEEIYGVKVMFSLPRGLGNAHYGKRIIKYNKYNPTSLLTIVHEVAHIIDEHNNGRFKGRKAHSSIHVRIVKKWINICRKEMMIGSNDDWFLKVTQ